MRQHLRMFAPFRTLADAMSWFGRWLLLIPEAALLIVMLALYLALDNAPIVGLAATGLVVLFLIRTLALHLGRIAIEAGHYRDANALLRVAMWLYPWSADAQALRGVFELACGDASAAEISLKRAIEFMPGQAGFYTALSSAQLDLGRPQEALRSAQQALRINEHDAQPYLYLAEAEQACGATDQVVEEWLREGLTLAQQPELAAALQCALAGHLLNTRRFAEASLMLNAAEALVMRCATLRQAELRYHLGALFIAQGQAERGREHFQGVEKIDPHGRHAAAAWRAARLS